MFRSSDRFARQVNARSTCRPFAFLDRRPDVSAGLADSLSYLQPWSIGTIDSGESVICPDNGNRQWKLHPFFLKNLRTNVFNNLRGLRLQQKVEQIDPSSL